MESLFQLEKPLGVCKSPPMGRESLYWYRKLTGLSPFLQVAATQAGAAQGWDLEGFGPVFSFSLQRRW